MSNQEAKKDSPQNQADGLIRKVFMDLDGVYADFDAFIEEQSPGYMKLSNGKQSEVIHKVMLEEVPKGMFWRLRPMHDFELGLWVITQLQQAGVNVQLLTATGQRKTGYAGVVAKDKTDWWKKHAPNHQINLNFSDRGVEKAKYASPDTLLIDDVNQNVNAFREAGGHVILHKTMEETVDELSLFFPEIFGVTA